MGADNLVDIRRWKNWDRIFAMVPVAVFDRPPYSLKAKTSFAAQRYARWRKQGAEAKFLASASPPAWAFFHTKLKAISSTAIRKRELEGLPHTDHC